LEDYSSVREFAARHRAALRKGGRQLRVLVNNAGASWRDDAWCDCSAACS
jgi:NAD(P)-dependent dehydrogenase (short-subunit alcohol dehydrogenase family)